MGTERRGAVGKGSSHWHVPYHSSRRPSRVHGTFVMEKNRMVSILSYNTTVTVHDIVGHGVSHGGEVAAGTVSVAWPLRLCESSKGHEGRCRHCDAILPGLDVGTAGYLRGSDIRQCAVDD